MLFSCNPRKPVLHLPGVEFIRCDLFDAPTKYMIDAKLKRLIEMDECAYTYSIAIRAFQ